MKHSFTRKPAPLAGQGASQNHIVGMSSCRNVTRASRSHCRYLPSGRLPGRGGSITLMFLPSFGVKVALSVPSLEGVLYRQSTTHTPHYTVRSGWQLPGEIGPHVRRSFWLLGLHTRIHRIHLVESAEAPRGRPRSPGFTACGANTWTVKDLREATARMAAPAG